ncbi:MAG TPA: alpha/beta fold hydrolase [Thermoanaerobaculia bacterium]|nr:alpha/beta fold hydrolase [Thermoanaerobaculia bacterium]
MHERSVPQRPSAAEERLSSRLFLALSPHLPRAVQPAPLPALAPFEELAVPRSRGPGVLTATWYPAVSSGSPAARGAVLLLHPWVAWGRAYFHHRGRIQALRGAGYHALALDLPGFGGSGAPAGFYDRDVEDGLAFLRRRIGSLPLHLWGVSSGGVWAHPALARTRDVTGAVFEDVSPHLIEWSWRMEKLKSPAFLVLRTLFPASYRLLDVRRFAPHLELGAVAYISGEKDPGVLPRETEEVSRLAGGRALVVPGAGHLGAIKLAQAEVLKLALDTFREAESARTRCRSHTCTVASP